VILFNLFGRQHDGNRRRKARNCTAPRLSGHGNLVIGHAHRQNRRYKARLNNAWQLPRPLMSSNLCRLDLSRGIGLGLNGIQDASKTERTSRWSFHGSLMEDL